MAHPITFRADMLAAGLLRAYATHLGPQRSFEFGHDALAAFAFEQEKVGDEVWLPSSGEVNISARIFLFAKFNRSMERRYSDYKKYKIDSQYELDKPKDGKPDNLQ